MMDVTSMRSALRNHLMYEARVAADRDRVIDCLESITLPQGASLSLYGIWGNTEICQLTVTVALDSALPYPERIKPIGETLRAFSTSKIERTVDSYGVVRFTGQARVNGILDCDITVVCSSDAISPLCTITKRVETRTVEQTFYDVQCPEGVQHA